MYNKVSELRYTRIRWYTLGIRLFTFRDWGNALSKETEGIDFEHRLRRARGRDSRNYIASARVTKSEQQELEEAARLEGKALSEWCRETLLGVARRETVTPIFTEVVAIRQLLNLTMGKVVCGNTMTEEAFGAELQSIRGTKHKAASEVMQQYAMQRKKRIGN